MTVVWEDVISVINLIIPHLIFIGIAIIAVIGIMIYAKKFNKKKRRLVRSESVIAFFMVVILIVNLIMTGPLKNLASSSFAQLGSLTEATIANSMSTIDNVASEGFVLAKNEENALPLENDNVNVFGWAATNPLFGGTGSGAIDTSTSIGILESLENAGYNLNQDLLDLYTKYRIDRPVIDINAGQDWTLPEVPRDQYSNDLIEEAQNFSENAIVVISRSGGEGADLPHDMGAVMDGSFDQGTKYTQASYENNSDDYDDFTEGQHYLELTQTERDMIELVDENFENVIVVYNGANTFELGWINEYENINGVILAPAPGIYGFNTLGNIINGEINPSGKTVDTWANDLTQTAVYNNIGSFAYDNVGDVVATAQENWDRADGIVGFLNYNEGIYVGYKFYETADEEGLIDYEEEVTLPFGYGLSFTDFEQEITNFEEDGGVVNVEVTVRNTGDTAGKEVVQLYYTPPYENGGIEKASVNLIRFTKTGEILPGDEAVLELEFPVEAMAAYDESGEGEYILEQGLYNISLRSDSHTVIVDETIEVDEDIIYPNFMESEDVNNKLEFANGDLTYLSRENGFENYEEATQAPTNFSATEPIEANGTWNLEEHNDPNDEMPTTDADNGLELFGLRGVAFDDPLWDDLLDQMNIDEVVNFIAYGGHQTPPIDSLGKARTLETDGPAGVNSYMTGAFGTGFPSELLLAQTWNTELSYEMGGTIASEFAEFGFSGWYGPSMNIHRSPFGGRNFEYYSEDGYLSGEMAVYTVDAAYEQGVYPFLKHFAFNEQETNRNAMVNTWLNEQSARELYLKPFEMVVKEKEEFEPLAIMSAFNYIGNDWVGSNDNLLNGILRGEWGFEGLVLSDYFGNYGYMDADRAIRGGTDVMLGTAGNEAILTDQTSATSVLNMRNAVKNALFTIVNSRAYETNPNAQMPAWQRTLYIITAVLVLFLALWAYYEYRRYQKAEKQI